MNRFSAGLLLLLGLSACTSAPFHNFNPADLPTEQTDVALLKDTFMKAADIARRVQFNATASSPPAESGSGPISANAADYRAAMLRYFDAGVTISNRICDTWFKVQFFLDRETNHAKTLSNIVGSTAIGVLGFTGADVKQLGILGISLAGVNSEFDNYMTYFLVSPALPTIKEKLDNGRQEYARRYRDYLLQMPVDELTFGRTAEGVSRYHELCSRLEIQKIVVKSVELSRYTVDESLDPVDQEKVKRNLQILFNNLSGNEGTLTEDVARALYIWERVKDSEKRIVDAYNAKFTANPIYKEWIQRAISKPENRALILETGDLLNAQSDYEKFIQSASPGTPIPVPVTTGGRPKPPPRPSVR